MGQEEKQTSTPNQGGNGGSGSGERQGVGIDWVRNTQEEPKGGSQGR